jgi:hypothetical protein
MGSPLDVLGLQTFVALDHIELNDFAFIQGFEALSEDGGVMHEDILSRLFDDETEALLVVEPFDLAAGHKLSPELGRETKKGTPLAPTNWRSLSNDEQLHAPGHFVAI